MRDRRTKMILYTLFIMIMNIAVVGYLYSKDSLDDAINEYQINNKIIENNFDVRPDISDLQIASATDLTMTVKGDMISLNYSYAGSYTFNTVNNYNSAKNITSVGGVKSGANGYVSLPNGTYYIYTYNYNNMSKIAKGPIYVKNSCTDERKTNQTGSLTLERCYVKTASGLSPNVSESLQVCASGYTLKQTNLNRSDCDNKKLENGITRRYCKVIYSLTCEKQSTSNPPVTVADARLSSLSVNTGTLSPAFNSSTFKYNVTVDSNTSSIQINATAASGSSFVSGSGPRTVNLNYGSNSIKVRVQNSAGKQTVYTINVNRPDKRSTVNTLSNLKASEGVLSPAFSSGETNYTIDVPNNVTHITLDATLTDNSSSFVAGFGPSTYALEPGPNKVYIKVASQKGDVNVYNITVNRETTPSECTTNIED
ncbi:MAG: cadherin-like beta sandwich domain-containing protein, partial [Bacilli bacterium]|nr:cadherin-like beta sandwich domain-containing protein [Bacilli bacterium]